MPWGKLDDKFHRHPKVKVAIKLGGLAAVGLHVLAISYSNDDSTDGFISEEWVGRQTRLAQVLVDARHPMKPDEPGLWEVVPGGWLIHDFLDHNPSAAKVQERREAARVRMNNARNSREVRTTPVPVPVPSPYQEVQVQEPRAVVPTIVAPPKVVRAKDRTPLQAAVAVGDSARAEAAWRLVEAAVNRFRWRLTKTAYQDELRYALELLDVFTEGELFSSLSSRLKLTSLRWFGEHVNKQQGASVAPRTKDRPPILDEPPPGWDADQDLADDNRSAISEVLS